MCLETLHLHVPNFKVADLTHEKQVEDSNGLSKHTIDVLDKNRESTNAPPVERPPSQAKDLSTELTTKANKETRFTRTKPIIRVFTPGKEEKSTGSLQLDQKTTLVAKRAQPRGRGRSRESNLLDSSRTSMLMEERHFRRQVLRETMKRIELNSNNDNSGVERVHLSSSMGKRESDELSALYREWHDKLLARETRNETNERAILQQMARLAERSLSLHMYEKDLAARRVKVQKDLDQREEALRLVQGKIETKLESVENTERKIIDGSNRNAKKEKELEARDLALREWSTAITVKEKVLEKEKNNVQKALRDLESRRNSVNEQAQISQEDALSAKTRLRKLHKIALEEISKRQKESELLEKELERRERLLNDKETSVKAAKEVGYSFSYFLFSISIIDACANQNENVHTSPQICAL